jgi:outer membrane immunogenic protein
MSGPFCSLPHTHAGKPNHCVTAAKSHGHWRGVKAWPKNFATGVFVLPRINLNRSFSEHRQLTVLGKNMHKFYLVSALATVSFISSLPALSADLDVMPPPPPPVEELRPATYDWTGISAGVFVAANAVEGKFNAYPICGCGVNDVSQSGIGFGGGARLGADYQFGEIVFGAIADWQIGGEIARNNHGIAESYLNMKHMGTIRGRVGWAFDDTLIYATGGYAMAAMEFGGETAAVNTKESQWAHGFAIGAGMEHAISDNFSIGAEYLYVNFGNTEHYLTGGTPATTGTVDMDYNDFHTVRATATYRFSL